MKFVLLIISFLAVLFLGSTLCAYLQEIKFYTYIATTGMVMGIIFLLIFKEIYNMDEQDNKMRKKKEKQKTIY